MCLFTIPNKATRTNQPTLPKTESLRCCSLFDFAINLVTNRTNENLHILLPQVIDPTECWYCCWC